jgi:tetratricopeptide (TPR) repeat protein
MTGRWRGHWLLAGSLALGLAACGGSGPTPLQTQYQQSEERALRYHARGELSRALQAFEESLRWAELADDRPAIMAQALNIGRVALALDQEPVAEQSFQRAQSTATALGDAASGLRASLGLAQLDLQQGRFDAAQAAFAQVLSEARQQRDDAATLAALNGLSLAQKGVGQRPAARQMLDEAEALARSHGDRRLLASTLANQGGLALQTGETDRAIRVLEEAIALDRATENLLGLEHDLLLLAQARQRRGDPAGALELYRQARTIARHTGQRAQAQRYDAMIERLERESGVRLPQGRVKSVAPDNRIE